MWRTEDINDPEVFMQHLKEVSGLLFGHSLNEARKRNAKRTTPTIHGYIRTSEKRIKYLITGNLFEYKKLQLRMYIKNKTTMHKILTKWAIELRTPKQALRIKLLGTIKRKRRRGIG